MKYASEGMDCKKMLLLFLGKLWVVLLAAVLGAVLGGGIYLFRHVVINRNRQYQAESKLYLDFAPDETGEVYQAYNGYTWNDLLSTDKILDTTMSYLPDTYTREEVVEAAAAQILSDLRLLTITVTTSDADKTEEILQATDRSLLDLGKREKEFINIEVIKETEARMLTASPRLVQAVLVGMVIALAFALLILALLYVLDDKIYVPGDLKIVTGLPFVGFQCQIQKGDSLSERFACDLERNQVRLREELGRLEVLELPSKNSLTEETYTGLREAEGVLIAVSYGKMDRTSLSYQIEQLTLQGCKPAGIMIQDVDMRFMKWYYNHL